MHNIETNNNKRIIKAIGLFDIHGKKFIIKLQNAALNSERATYEIQYKGSNLLFDFCY